MKRVLCVCGEGLRDEVCRKCGNVYDIDISVSINTDKTAQCIKDFIIENSSVREFSDWEFYYDFNCAGSETLQAYANDCYNH